MSKKLLYIFLLAFLVRMLFFSIALAQSNGSLTNALPAFDGYIDSAKNLLAGNGFSRSIAPPYVPDSVRTPLYPLFLALILYAFNSYYVLALMQILLGSVIPLLAFRIAKELFSDERAATATAIFLAVEPFGVSLSTTLQAETLFTVLFLGGLTLFFDYAAKQNARILAWSALLFALATLARPTIQYLPLLLIPAAAILLRRDWKRALGHTALFAGIFLFVLSPWSIRNLLRFGNPALTVQYASVPYGYLIPSTIALEQHIGFREAQQAFYEGEGGITDVEEITLANAPFYKKRTAEILTKHPVGLIKSSGMTFLTFFTHDGYLDVLRRVNAAPSIRLTRPAFSLLLESPKKAWEFMRPFLGSPALLVILGRIAWILIALCFIWGALCYLRTPPPRAKGVVTLLVILYFALTTIAVGFAVNARFRFPVNALILPFAVYGIMNVLKRPPTSKRDTLNA